MVDVFYSNVLSAVERQERGKWLDEFKNQPVAWNVGVELLTRTGYQVFAANMLQEKIGSSWSSLLKEHKKELCDVVLATITDPNSNGSLRTSLCKTVTQIIQQSTPHDWPDPISDTLYMSELNPDSPFDMRIVWVELVRTIAEAANQSPTTTTSQQHDLLKKYIRNVSAELVIKTLLGLVEQNCMNNESSIASDALSALIKWFILNPETSQITLTSVEIVVRSMLANPDMLVSSGAEVIDAILGLFSLPKYPQMVESMLEVILNLGPLLQPFIESEDNENVMSLLTIFSSIGINHPSILLKTPENGVVLASLVNQCCQVKEAISSEVFDFWKSLLDDMESDPNYDDLLALYNPVFQDAIKVMIQQCRISEDDDDDVETEQDTRMLRKDCADSLLQFFGVIAEEELEILYNLLQESLANYDRQSSAEGESWIEVALWGWASLTEDFADEEEWPLKLMRLFDSLPRNSVSVQKMAMALIGSLAHWLGRHTNALPTALTYVLNSLENSEIADLATNSLVLICEDCGESLPPLLDEFMEKLEPAMGGLTSKQQCRIIGCLSSQVTYLDPNRGLGLIEKLSGGLPNDLLTLTRETNQFNLLQRGRLVDGLNFISALLVSPGDPMERDEPVPDRHVMSCPAPSRTTPNEKYITQVQWAQIALLPLVEQTWPIAEAIVMGAELDEEFCVPVIRYIERVSTSLKRYTFASYLPRALTLLTTMFHRTGSVKVFKLYDLFAGVFRTVYNQTEAGRLVQDEMAHIVELGLLPPAPSASITNPPCDIVVAFSAAFTQFSELALQLFAGGTGAEEVELIQHFYHYCVTPTVNFLPRAFFANVDCVVAVSQFSSNVLPALHRSQELRHMYRYLRCLFSVEVSNAMTEQECQEFQDFKRNLFEVMMTNIFAAIGGESPRSTIPMFAEMLHYYLHTYPQLCTSTLEAVLSKPGFPTNAVSMDQKRVFIGKFIQAVRSPESMSAVLHDFSVHCRGIESTFLATVRPHA